MTPTGKTGWLVAAMLVLPSILHADDRGRGPKGVPPGHLPPPGQCRVWHDGRPPGHQPAPTDCATARRDAARSGGRVLYGDDRGRGWDDDDRWDDRGRDDDDYRRGRDRDDDRWGSRRNGRYDDPHGYGYDFRCSDRDWRSGACDNWQARCPDRDRDGWCDGSGRGRYGRLPDMVWGPLFAQGRVARDLRLWLPSPYLGVQFRDYDRNGVPEEVVWLDDRRRPVQAWLDENRDGRADRVVIYRAGRAWRTLR